MLIFWYSNKCSQGVSSMLSTGILNYGPVLLNLVVLYVVILAVYTTQTCMKIWYIVDGEVQTQKPRLQTSRICQTRKTDRWYNSWCHKIEADIVQKESASVFCLCALCQFGLSMEIQNYLPFSRAIHHTRSPSGLSTDNTNTCIRRFISETWITHAGKWLY